jgi:hypothetical protein
MLVCCILLYLLCFTVCVCLLHLQGSNVLTVPGRQYPVDIYYTPTPEQDFVDAAMLTCLQVRTAAACTLRYLTLVSAFSFHTTTLLFSVRILRSNNTYPYIYTRI